VRERAGSLIGSHPRIELLAEVVLAAVFTVTAAGAAVRIALGAGPLWRDEVHLVNMAQMPSYGQMLDVLATDSAPALYVTLVRAWTWPGWSHEDAALRVLGLLVTFATFAVVWFSARRLGVTVPLITLALVAAHGFVLDTLGTVRPHGPGVLLAMFALAVTWMLVAAPGRRSFLTAMTVFVVSVQTLFTLAVTIAGLCLSAAVVAAVRRDWRTTGLVVAAGAVAAASLMPYAGIIRQATTWSALDAQTLSILPAVMRVAAAFGGTRLGLAVIWILTIGIGVGAGVTLLAMRASLASRARVAYACLSIAIVPLMYFTFLVAKRQPMSYWHFAWLMGLVALALDTVFVERRWLRWTRLALVVLALPWVVPLAGDLAKIRRTNVDLIAAHLAANARSNDLILVNPWSMRITLTRYYRGDTGIVTLPPIDAPRLYRHDLVMERMASLSPLAPMHDAIERTLRGGHRVWLIGDLSLPPAGQSPVVLPPAPGASTGWSYPPYSESWMMQTGDLLRRRARHWQLIDLHEPRAVHDVEHPRFGVVEGWRGE
jgi:hypothetical protein